MKDSTKNLLIGLFVITACALIIFIIMFLSPSLGDEKQVIYVRFSNINKINVGTRVMFAGKPIGEVTEISVIPNARENPHIDKIGQVYYYQLKLNIDSKVKVYDTDDFRLETSGLLGEKGISIIPKEPPPGVQPKILDSKPAYADSVDPIQNAFIELSEVADEFETTLKKVEKWIDDNGEHLSESVTAFRDAMTEMSLSFRNINDTNLIEDISNTAQNITGFTQQLQDDLSQLERDNTFTNLADTIENFKNASKSISTISQNLEEGKGTLGKFIESDDFYLRLNSLMSKIDTMMTDINNYGLFFSMDKSWQRTRLKKAHEIAALKTPEEFKEYFENELATINASMSRISLLIDQTQEKDKLITDPMFKQDFRELLSQVKALSETLRSYNEELMDINKQIPTCP